MTTKSAVRLYFLAQFRKMSLAALTDDTIGAIFVLASPTKSGKFIGRPAPEIITSAPASTVALTTSS